MKKILIVLGLSMCLVLPRLVLADDKPAKPLDNAVKPVVVPFELLPSGHMAVMVKVNNKGPYKLIFDTGAPITLINSRAALQAGLIKEKKTGWLTNQAVTIKELQVGERNADNVHAMVMDHPTVDAISRAFQAGFGARNFWRRHDYGPIDGIVGFPFFARYKVTLDYQAKTLTFVPNGFEPPDVMQGMTAAIMEMTSGKARSPVVLAPAAQWGIVTTKGAKDEEPGVDVKTVLPGSPAANAGLKPGDRLLTLDGRWTDTVADVYAAAGFVKPGISVPVKVQRGGKEMTLTVKPAAGL